MRDDELFCPECGVRNDLHYDEDDCDGADMKARLLEDFGRLLP